jgi:hypothetical protein
MNLSADEREYVEKLFDEVKVEEPREKVEKRQIRIWFLQLPADVRKKAIMNSTGWALSRKEASLSDALITAFVWHETPEGGVYWDKIHSDFVDKGI